MKNENLFLKVIKERYLSLIIIPIVILLGLFIYAHVNGIVLNNDWEHSLLREENFSCLIGVGVFLYFIVALFKILFQWGNLYFADALGELIRAVVIGIVYSFGQESSNFTQKVENFQKEKRYYLRQVEIQGSVARDGKGKLLGFDLFQGEDSYSCQIYYDESDTLLDPVNDHRGLSFAGTLGENKIGNIPIRIKKIEPHFYYVCRDYRQFQPDYKKTSKDKK